MKEKGFRVKVWGTTASYSRREEGYGCNDWAVPVEV